MKTIFELIFENSPVALILVNEGGIIKLINKNAEQLFGYDRKELVGKSVEILVPEAHRGRHPTLVSGYVASPQPRQMGRGRNLFGTRKGGKEFPIEVGLNPIHSDEGTLIMSSVIDISDRIRAEDRFRSAVEAAPNGMVMINSNGEIILVNKQTEDMFGYTRSELVGMSIGLLIPDDVKQRHPFFIKAYIAKPEPRSMGMGRELFGRKKDGSKIPVEIGLRPVFTEEGTLVISSIVDVTERQKAAALLKEKNEELEQFSYRTSHDLRSPLLSIGQLTDCIAEDLENGDVTEARANNSKINFIASRLGQLVEDILKLTKSDFINEPVAEFNFATAIEAIERRFEQETAGKAFHFRKSFNHDRPLVTQSTRLQQVLDNFFSNAIKYQDTAKPEQFVIIKTYNDAEFFYLQIQDNGIGIPAAHQNEVFAMFKRFHAKGIVGSGLGLYIVRKHLEKLSADIRFESTPAGTTFYLKFPLNITTR